MKLIVVIAAAWMAFLAVLSFLLPPLPVWAGGLIGIAVFLVGGNLAARLID
jgi:hypothetical protein